MIDAAIVGLGWWGQEIVKSVQGKSDRVRFVRAVTKEPGETQAFAAEHGLAVTNGIDDVIADASIAAVHLATPHSLHADQIARVAAAGKHVFCEKPLCLTRADAEAAVAACESAGVVLGVGQNRRFWQPIAEIKRMIAAGELGTIMLAEGNYSHDMLADTPSASWRTNPADAPAAGMTGMGIHIVDAFVHLVGRVAQVTVACEDRLLGRPAGDTVAGLFRFENGAVGTLGSTLVTAFQWRLEVMGSAGWAETRGENELSIALRGTDPQSRSYPPGDSILAEWTAFLDAIDGRAPFPIPPDEIIHTVAVMEAIFESAATGRTVAVD